MKKFIERLKKTWAYWCALVYIDKCVVELEKEMEYELKERKRLDRLDERSSKSTTMKRRKHAKKRTRKQH